MVGNQPGFEEATRALFAGDAEDFEAESEVWPPDGWMWISNVTNSVSLIRSRDAPMSSICLPKPLMSPRQQDCPSVFPGRFDKHRKDIKGQWEHVRQKAGLEDVGLHNLRRTVGSWLAQQGTPIQVIGKILNHSHPAVTAVYARLADEQSKQAMNVLGEKMGEVLALPSLGDHRG